MREASSPGGARQNQAWRPLASDKAAEAPLARIVALERELAPLMPDRRAAPRLDRSVQRGLRDWSAAVWSAAEALGPAELEPEEVERGKRLAARPVFICGAHRSGTTLVRDLLEAHPALVVLPSEGGYYTQMARRLGRLPAGRRMPLMGQEWLRRLANPNNQPPHWLIGRSDLQASPYVAFARDFQAWWRVLEQRSGKPGASLWPLLAVVLAYAGRAGGGEIPPRAGMWVEKTPTNERFLDRLWAQFPNAKVIHVVRRPDAALASYRRLVKRSRLRPSKMLGALGRLARSCRVAADMVGRASPERYHLVRYEQLVDAPAETIGRLASYLGIEPLEIMFRPTVAGMPATRNSSFTSDEDRRAIRLARFHRDALAVLDGGAAARIGYPGIAPATPLGRLGLTLRRRLRR